MTKANQTQIKLNGEEIEMLISLFTGDFEIESDEEEEVFHRLLRRLQRARQRAASHLG